MSLLILVGILASGTALALLVASFSSEDTLE